MLEAIVRLYGHALEGLTQVSPTVLVAYGFCISVMMYAEGYRGFQQRFSPRFASRARVLRESPTPIRVVLAPLYCMAMFDAPRRRVVASWLLVVMIVGFIVIVRQLEQPWRGAVDAGVVAGLSYGLTATVACFIREFRSGRLYQAG